MATMPPFSFLLKDVLIDSNNSCYCRIETPHCLSSLGSSLTDANERKSATKSAVNRQQLICKPLRGGIAVASSRGADFDAPATDLEAIARPPLLDKQ